MRLLPDIAFLFVIIISVGICAACDETPKASMSSKQSQLVEIGDKKCTAYNVQVGYDKPVGGGYTGTAYLWYIDCGNGDAATQQRVQNGKTHRDINVIQSQSATCSSSVLEVKTPPPASPVFECTVKPLKE